MKRLWLISYDIADGARRYQVGKLLLGLGERVLESLFECPLRADQLPALRKRLEARIDPQHDRVALIPLCRWCQDRTRSHGLGRRDGRDCPHYFVV